MRGKEFGVLLKKWPWYKIAGRAGLTACTGIWLLSAAPAFCDAPAKGQMTMQDLARAFAQKLGPRLADADAALQGGIVLDRRARQGFDALADGEPLLLTTIMREAKAPAQSRYEVTDPINAIKQGYDVFLSLTDFNYIAGIPIKVDAANSKASGWYKKEDQKAEINLATHEFKLGNTVTPFKPDDIIVENDDFYVRETILGDWFGFKAQVFPQAQRIEISTSDPLPLQARLNRMRHRKNILQRQQPEQPRLPQPYKAVTVPRADVLLSQQWEKRGDDAQPINFSRYNVLATNQLLDHEVTSYVAGTVASNRDSAPIEQARINFRKESENNDLLGPLHAKVYEFNDLQPVTITGTGGASTERGIRVSNRSDSYSVDTATVVEGDAQPGWDVELYRNSAFIAGTTVDDTGHYSFDNVQLFAGDNRFHLIYYGPQGEQTEEDRIVTVLPSLVGNLKGYYDMSLTQNDEITYKRNESDNPDRGTPRLVASYDRRAGDNLTLRGGINSRQANEQRDNYFYTGAVTNLGDAIVNADVITTSDGPFKSLLTARRNFGRHSASGTLEYASSNFSDNYIDEKASIPAEESVYASVTGPFIPAIWQGVTYQTNNRLTLDENNNSKTLNDFGLSSFYQKYRFNNELRLTTDQSDTADRPHVLDYSGSVTSRYDGYLWRGRLDYEIIPDREPSLLSFDVNKAYSERLSADASLLHQFYLHLSELSAGLTYRADTFRISPNLSYDTDNNIKAKVDINFGLARDPASGNIVMSGRSVSAQAGLEAFAFLDKDGDGTFDGDDEPLPDVVIRAVQVNTELITDKEGKASSTTVPANRLTDVVMDTNSSFDPTWVPGYAGASVRLRPSETVRLEFPVLRGAEMDGTASLAGMEGAAAAARSMNIHLMTPEGKTIKDVVTPFDGFFVIEAIPPGVYYLTTDSSDSPTKAYRVPEKIVITPQGGQLYGHNISLTRGYNIPFTFSATNADPSQARRVHVLRESDIARQDVLLRLGNYNSSLAMAFDWYKFRLQTRGWKNAFTPVAKSFDDVARDGKTNLLPLQLRPKQPIRLEDAAALCEKLVDAGFTGCGVDVVTTYQAPAQDAAAAPPQKKG